MVYTWMTCTWKWDRARVRPPKSTIPRTWKWGRLPANFLPPSPRGRICHCRHRHPLQMHQGTRLPPSWGWSRRVETHLPRRLLRPFTNTLIFLWWWRSSGSIASSSPSLPVCLWSQLVPCTMPLRTCSRTNRYSSPCLIPLPTLRGVARLGAH